MPDEACNERSHYEVLGFVNSASTSKQDLKTAYHRALLYHHPDKAQNASVKDGTTRFKHDSTVTYTIDQITTAYNIISDPVARASYDKQLSLTRKKAKELDERTLHDGLETYDLDDLKYDDDRASWYRECRCGDQRGYLLNEADLDGESSEGQIYIACKGCSLWIKVLFSLAEDDLEE